MVILTKRLSYSKTLVFVVYALQALVVAGLVIYAKLFFNTFVGNSITFLLLLFLIILNSLYGRFKWGIFITVFIAVIVDYIFLITGKQPLNMNPSRMFQVMSYALPAVAIVALVTKLDQSREEEVRQRKWFEVTLSSIADAVVATDRQGRVAFMNKEAQRLTGWKINECMGRNLCNVLKIINEETKEVLENPAETILRESCNIGLTNHMLLVSRNGNEIPIENNGSPIRDDRGKMIGTVLVFRDVLAKKVAERQLAESEKRFKALVQSSIIGIVLATTKGKLIEANDAFLDMVGYTREDMQLGKVRLDKITPKKYLDQDKEMAAQLRKYGYYSPKEKEYVRKDGVQIPVLIGGKMLDEARQLEVGFAIDISEQKKIKLELEKTNKRISHVLDSISDGFVALDQNWRYIYINKEAERINKKVKEEHLGKSIFEVWPDFEKSVWYPAYKNAMEEGEVVTLEAFFEPQQKWYESRVYPSENGISVYFHDVTARKELEQRKDEFISIASHELKTPLTSIKGYNQILERMVKDWDNEKVKLYLKKTSLYIDRLNSLITDLLDVSKIQSGKLQLNTTEFDFDELVREGIDSVQLMDSHHVILCQGKACQKVTGDKERLEQVFTNLLVNAIKYSPNADKVIVSVTCEGGFVKVGITDFGIGIDKQHQEQIFERFYRVDDPSKKFSGLGIGLYISQEIISRHGGKIWVKSEVGEGSTFFFTIPVYPSIS